MAATSRFGISLKQLRDLMEYRGAEGVQKLNEELGGVKGLVAKLNTSETNGKKWFLIILGFAITYTATNTRWSFFLIKKELFLAQNETFNFWKDLLNGFFLDVTGSSGLSNDVSFVSVIFTVSKD